MGGVGMQEEADGIAGSRDVKGKGCWREGKGPLDRRLMISQSSLAGRQEFGRALE